MCIRDSTKSPATFNAVRNISSNLSTPTINEIASTGIPTEVNTTVIITKATDGTPAAPILPIVAVTKISKYSSKDVLEGIENAKKAGFENIKINMVVKKNINDNDIIPMLEYFEGSGCIVRFIEFMDVGNVNLWDKRDVLILDDIIDIISKRYSIKSLQGNYKSEVAKRWSYAGGEFGIISSISKPFCGECSRVRLTAEGKLFTCLFASKSHDIKNLLRSSESDSSISNYLLDIWSERDDRYSETRMNQDDYKIIKKAEMSYIGG